MHTIQNEKLINVIFCLLIVIVEGGDNSNSSHFYCSFFLKPESD